LPAIAESNGFRQADVVFGEESQKYVILVRKSEICDFGEEVRNM